MRLKKFLFFSLLFFIGIFVLSLVITIASKDSVSLGQKIALVRIEGPILDAKNIVSDIKSYTKDTSIKAIVIRVDSPGGAVVPSQEIHDAVKRAVEHKTVVVSMGSVAASGGYYLAVPADVIIANPGTLTGSIGVIMEIPNAKELLNKIGIKSEVIKSGKHKDMASIFRGVGKEERDILQNALDDVHDQFITAVAEGRELDINYVRQLADGRIFTGRQAQQVGLVDELGDLQYAIKTAAEMVGIVGEPEVISKRDRHPLYEMLSGDFASKLMFHLFKPEFKYLMSF